MKSQAAAALLFALAACSEPGWREVSTDALSAADAARLELARTATQVLGQRLMGTLGEALEAGGAGAAIVVCSDMAPDFAADVAEATGLAIGRTSFRRRNPGNQPPDWAAASVAARVEQEQVWLGPDGGLGLLRPIPTAPLCVQCHGSTGEIEAATELALRDLYPEDAATGFAVGDVRGYFWVEAPPAP